jgi:hypothetical protein
MKNLSKFAAFDMHWRPAIRPKNALRGHPHMMSRSAICDALLNFWEVHREKKRDVRRGGFSSQFSPWHMWMTPNDSNILKLKFWVTLTKRFSSSITRKITSEQGIKNIKETWLSRLKKFADHWSKRYQLNSLTSPKIQWKTKKYIKALTKQGWQTLISVNLRNSAISLH